MFCKWCGLESETNDVCSWCRKPFSTAAAAPAAPTAAAAPSPPPPTTVRSTPSFDNYDDLPPPAAAEMPVDSAPARTASTGPVSTGGGLPLGDTFDDIDDDLSAFPFGGGAFQPAPLPPRSAAPAGPPPPTFAAPASPATQSAPNVPPGPAPTAAPPPVRPQDSAPLYAGPPAAPAPGASGVPVSDARPPIEAIPIRLKTPGGANPPPPVVPLKSPSSGPAPAPLTPPARPASGPTVSPPTFRNPGAPPAAPAAPSAGPAPESRPTVQPAPVQVPLDSPQASPPEIPAPIAARADTPVQDAQPESLDLGLKPLVIEDEEDSAPLSAPGGRRLDLGGSPGGPPRPSTGPTPPPPSRPAAPSLSTALGRTIYCRWCGMNSDDPNICTWCRRDLKSAPAPAGKPAHVTITHGPVRGKPVRQPVVRVKEKGRDRGRKEPLPDLLASAPKNEAQNGAGLPKAAPQIGSFQAAKSKYYSDQVVDPVSGAHYDADSGKTTDEPVEVREKVDTNDWTQLGIYSAVFIVLIVAVYVIGGMVGRGIGGYFTILAVASFIAGMLLPVLRVSPWPKDDSEDVGWAMGIIPLFGPFAGTMAYGVLGVVRQDANPAILGVFITSLLLRVVLDLATGHSFSKMVPFSEMSGLVLGGQVMPFVTLAGWYASEVFHKPDE